MAKARSPRSGLSDDTAVTVRGRALDGMDDLTSAERRVARELISAYPLAGLETVAELARRAGVSGPTVLRFVTKIGFDNYPGFQRALREEIQASLSSPAMLFERRPRQRGELLDKTKQRFLDSITSSFTLLSEPEFYSVVRCLADGRRRIIVTGGRYSQVHAFAMFELLHTVRPNVHFLGAGPTPRMDIVVDVGKRDVLVVFDFRRYQKDSIELSRQVSERGAPIVLFTDPWLSPIARIAKHVLVASVEAASPFDSIVPALALAETVVAGVVLELGENVRERLEVFQRLRAGLEWEDEEPAGP